jgi:phosphatidylinositol alpha-mannosyltransferase
MHILKLRPFSGVLLVHLLIQTINIGTFMRESRPSYRWAMPLMVSRLYKKWFKKLDGRIAVSRPAMEFINKHYPSTYEIIPNGVDIKRYCPEVLPLPEYRDGKINILFLGRAEKRKGLEYMLKAYGLIKPDLPDCRLIIVSRRSRSRHKYEDFVKESGLPDVVFVDGSKVDEDQKPRYYSTADIYCSPATGHESQGIVLLEAMATGKPVVASSISGYASVITDGEEGILVPPKQEVPLAHALAALIKDESLRRQMGEKGRNRSAAYGWEFVSRKIMDYYTRILINRTVRI